MSSRNSFGGHRGKEPPAGDQAPHVGETVEAWETRNGRTTPDLSTMFHQHLRVTVSSQIMANMRTGYPRMAPAEVANIAIADTMALLQAWDAFDKGTQEDET